MIIMADDESNAINSSNHNKESSSAVNRGAATMRELNYNRSSNHDEFSCRNNSKNTRNPVRYNPKGLSSATATIVSVTLLLLHAPLINCCDLHELVTGNGKTQYRSIELWVEQSQVVFRGLTTDVYGYRIRAEDEILAANDKQHAVLMGRQDGRRSDDDDSGAATSGSGDAVQTSGEITEGGTTMGDGVKPRIKMDESVYWRENEKGRNGAGIKIGDDRNEGSSKSDSRNGVQNIPDNISHKELYATQRRDMTNGNEFGRAAGDSAGDVGGKGGGDAVTAYFELINTYKGAATLTVWDSNRYSALQHKINVTFHNVTPDCTKSTTGVPIEYIVFCNLVGSDLQALFVVSWSEESELRVWNALGWGSWSDWSTCSVSCGSGIQQRSRFCQLPSQVCSGHNIEQRVCNLFSCSVAVNPLALEDRRFFHPSRSQWARVPERPDAWRLQPNAYIWVPVSQVFPSHATPGESNTNSGSSRDGKIDYGSFPKEFTVFVTLRIENDTRMGTLWSLRSRRQQDAYLSLELAGDNQGVNLVHANGANGTDIVRIPARLGDGHWHKLAIGISDDSTVNTFLDCEWLRTDILKRDALDTPEDADLIIGYLFTGDLEQLVIVSNAEAVSQQCAPTRIPIADSSLETRRSHVNTSHTKKTLPILNNSSFQQELAAESIHSNIIAKKKPPGFDDQIVEMSNKQLNEMQVDVSKQFDSRILIPEEDMEDYSEYDMMTTVVPTKRSRTRGRKNHHHKKSKKKIRKEMTDETSAESK